MVDQVSAHESTPANPRQAVAGLLAGLGEPEKVSVEEPQVTPEEDESGLEDEVTKASEENQEETEEGEAGGEGAGDEEGEETPSVEDIRTLKDLAAAIEVEPEFLYNLKMPLNTGGEPVALGEIKDKLQEAERVTAQKGQLEQERTALRQERDAWTQQQQQALNQPQEIVGTQARMVALQQAWKHLEDNRTSYEAGDLALKRQELQTEYSSAQQELSGFVQQAQQHQEQQRLTRAQEEAVKLLAAVPEWKDRAVAEEGRTRINTALHEYGFTPTEIDGVYDHRILRLFHDFALMKAGVKEAETIISKGRRAPKVLRAGGGRRAGSAKKDKLKQKMEAAKAETSLRKKGAFVADLLSGA